jgi:primosomal protein N' (replication factor Y)
MSRTVAVLVPYPVDKAYDYLVPANVRVQAGDYVTVPLGQREITGVVWGAGTGEVATEKLKPVIERLNLPPMPEIHRDFIDWVVAYTLSPKGSVLKMSLSAPGAFAPPKPATGYRLSAYANPDAKGLSDARKKILMLMQDGQVRRAAEIEAMTGASASVVKGLAEKKLLDEVELLRPYPCTHPGLDRPGPDLSAAQKGAAEILKSQIGAGAFKATLLDGVTGAGKTETYFEAVAECLRKGQQVLILLPEIALSNAFLDRFRSRFGCDPALWHSHLTPAQRRLAWRGVAEGETQVVVGARSALFLPYSDLGLIVVDEEHDPAYKQEDGVIYHARDMAVVRAHLAKIPVVLVSATPSLETAHNTWAPPEGTGRYGVLHLPARYGGASLPEIKVVDLKEDQPERGSFLSPTLLQAMKETLAQGEQVLLFLNRRGYAPLTLCRTCGHRFECPRCTAWLVEHKKSGRLHCHHCGHHAPVPKTCPECGEADTLVACGPGVERIHEEVTQMFRDARTIVLASDTTEGNEDLQKKLAAIRDHEVDIIVGTQIIAKGHHFPGLTLVGVVDADLGLNGGDLRAAERTYQLLHQVAGRAGREQKKGRVFLQSWMPEHRIMKALANGERDEFLLVEAMERKDADMPPFSRLAGIIVAGREEGQVIELARALGKTAPQGMNEKGQKIQTLGPAAAPLARLRGKHRYRLLVRADRALNIQKTIAEWVGGHKIPANIRVYVDIDPQGFL